MADYRVFSKEGCSSCTNVKNILRNKKIDFDIIDLATDEGWKKAKELNITSAGTIIDKDDNIVNLQELLQSN